MRCVRRSDDTPAVPHVAALETCCRGGSPAKLDLVSTAERQYPRFAADVGIKFLLGQQVAEGRTRNVSRGGLCADVQIALAVGKDVELDMQLVFDDNSVSEPLRLPARIVWCTQVEDAYQVGVAFRPLDKDRAQYLSLFLKYLGDEKAQKMPKAANIDDRFR